MFGGSKIPKIAAWLLFFVALGAHANSGVRLKKVDQASPACILALASNDLSEPSDSVRSHFSHTSIWEIRKILWPNQAQFWVEYVDRRYGFYQDQYFGDPVQLARVQDCLERARAGDYGAVGELQIAEKYWQDPHVVHLEWIKEFQRPKEKTPDFRVFFDTGNSKLVEVKTRDPELEPGPKYINQMMTAADEQVRDYKKYHSDQVALPAELEIVLPWGPPKKTSFKAGNAFSTLEKVDISKRQHLTRVTINTENRPFYRIERELDDIRSAPRVVNYYLLPPKGSAKPR